MSDPAFRRIAPLEIAAGWVPGVDEVDGPHALRPPEGVRAALEAVLRPALASGRCFVAFSGGRDSSVVLAAATHVARTDGSPPPVPVTVEHRRAGPALEGDWQERVVRHLELDEWVRLPGDDAVDLLGPDARRSLREHGVLWPTGIHTQGRLFAAAEGGWLLTGDGGDEILGPHRIAPVTQLLAGRRPTRARVRLAVTALLPRPARRAALGDVVADAVRRPWLRPPAAEAFQAAVIEDEVGVPLRWDRAVRRQLRRRAVRVGLHNLRLMAGARSTRLLHPFLEPRFVEAVARRGGRLGYESRTAGLEDLFGGLLPDDVLRRRGKARFGEVAMGPRARRFVGEWGGEGVDHTVVDADRLRREWRRDEPHAGSLLLLQAAWLATEQTPRTNEERGRRRG